MVSIKGRLTQIHFSTSSPCIHNTRNNWNWCFYTIMIVVQFPFFFVALADLQQSSKMHISKTTKIFLDFWPFRALFLLSARRKEVTSITSLTSSQFTVEFIKVSNIYFKICGCSGQCRDIQNMHETQCLLPPYSGCTTHAPVKLGVWR